MNCLRISAAIENAKQRSNLYKLHEIRQDLLETRSQIDFLTKVCEDGIELIEAKTNLSERELLEKLSEDRDKILDWKKFFANNDPSIVLNVILSSWKKYSKNIAFLGRSLFLICVFEDDDVALKSLRQLYMKYDEGKFMEVVYYAGDCARIEHDSRGWGCNWLENYNRIFVVYVEYFDGIGLSLARRFWNYQDVLFGYIAAEMYRSGYSISDCLSGNDEEIELILSIISSSPNPLSQMQIRELAIYSLRNFDIRRAYFESTHDDFHCYLILNANISGVLPENKGIRPYLEKLGHCEEEV